MIQKIKPKIFERGQHIINKGDIAEFVIFLLEG